MKIELPELRIIASDFLEFLNKEEISSIQDLENRLNRKYLIHQKPKDMLSFKLRPSNLGTKTHTISYTRDETGIPLEIKINNSLKYSIIILKAQNIIEGYNIFNIDTLGNLVQNKIIPSVDFSESKLELERLKNYQNENRR